MAYTEVTVSGYNASPPPDDGTQVAANEVTWAGIKSKIGDPIKTAFDTCQANITDVVSNEIEVNLWAPATTAAIFYQAAAPTHWTKSTTNNDKAIRVVSGLTGGTAGGTTAFSTVMAARTIAQANLPSYNLSAASLTATPSLTAASHTHTGHLDANSSVITGVSSNQSSFNLSGTGTQVVTSISTNNGSDNFTTASSGALGVSGTVTIGGSVPSGGSGTAMDFAIQYCDVIIATKD